METFELHPTGRSEDASQAKARQNAIIRKELQQSSKAVTKSQRVKLGRRGLTRRTASNRDTVCLRNEFCIAFRVQYTAP